MNIITGGVTAPKGFKAAGIHCGVKDNFTTPVPDKKDLAMVLSDVPCAAAGTYTRNVVKADPVILTKEYLADHKAQGIILDSGNANACAPKGMENAKRMAAAAAAATGLAPQDFAVCSTGIIGVELNITAIEAGVPALVAALADTEQASNDAAHAILTTDLKIKEIAVTTEIGGKTVTVGAIAKGSGMIHPNMGTMLCAVTTDCAIDGAVLQDMLRHIVTKTFNRITVDGDTSTNDSIFLLANGASGVEIKTEEDKKAMADLVLAICTDMARRVASDGEGATHLIEVEAYGLPTEHDARLVAKSIAGSMLFKAAVFGRDANWGRIMAAAGYSGADVDPTRADCIIKSAAGEVQVMKDGFGAEFSEELAKKVLTEHDITVIVRFYQGDGEAKAWGCDLTYDYVKINGDYRT